MLLLIDTHCHLDEYEHPAEVAEVASAAGVGHIIAVGMHVAKFQAVLDLAATIPGVVPALGIHPEEVKDYPAVGEELDTHVTFIRYAAPRLVAIGEIGLDHHFVKDSVLWPLEEVIFGEMLPIAEEFHLPVSLHVKAAEDRVLDMLASYSLPAVVIHWFSGPDNVYTEAIDRGYYFSVPRAVTYSPRVQIVARDTPVDQLLLESDGPAPFHGTTGEPKDCVLVCSEIAAMRGMDPTELEVYVEENTRKAFPKVFQD
jgi:TatD DNase family protein